MLCYVHQLTPLETALLAVAKYNAMKVSRKETVCVQMRRKNCELKLTMNRRGKLHVRVIILTLSLETFKHVKY